MFYAHQLYLLWPIWAKASANIVVRVHRPRTMGHQRRSNCGRYGGGEAL